MSLVRSTPIPELIEEVGHRVIGCAITVHRILGPGFREQIYKRALCLELAEAGLSYECEKKILVPQGLATRRAQDRPNRRRCGDR